MYCLQINYQTFKVTYKIIDLGQWTKEEILAKMNVERLL